MGQISIIGIDGKPILYAYLDDGDLKFQFEHYGRSSDEGDYEYIHTVASGDFPSIAKKFGFDPTRDILEVVQEITDLGHGNELKNALTTNEIRNELWTWLSTPFNG